MKESIEFLMIISNRAVLLAKYTIKALLKSAQHLSDIYDIKVTLCLNGFNVEKNMRYINEYLQCADCKRVNVVFGGGATSKDFIYDDGSYHLPNSNLKFNRPMLSCPVVWDEYYRNSKADYLITIDDDLEILNPTLIEKMLLIMKNHNLHVFSSDKTQECAKYDTYSQGNIIAMERNDTWLCIYDLKAYRNRDESMAALDRFVNKNGQVWEWRNDAKGGWLEYELHFRNEEGTRYVWDDAGWLQKSIRDKFNEPCVCITDFDSACARQSIHYAHFSNNSYINTSFKTCLFRWITLIEHTSNNRYAKKVCRKVKNVIFSRANNFRNKDRQISKMD